jgi:acid phosphatase type 7
MTGPTTSMGVMWSTRTPTVASVVNLGLSASNLNVTFPGTSAVFTDVGNTQTIHRANMTSLNPGTTYFYTVGDGYGNTSSTYSFTTAAPSSPSTTGQPGAPGSWGKGTRDYPVVAVYGDMGVDVNAHKTLPLLLEDATSGALDVVVHIGDVAYDLDSNSAANGDEFMVNIQPFAATIPYHVCPGNHESASDFKQYIARFDMFAGDEAVRHGNSVFHSVDVGPLHYVLFDSELFFYGSGHGLFLLPEAYAWLEADLAAINRTATPWVAVGAHRPLYCSPNDDNDECHSAGDIERVGIVGAYGLEPLLAKYGVELFFGAHEHSVELTFPVYNYVINTTSVTTLSPSSFIYTDFDRPVHILTGAAGCPENQDPWQPKASPFSAFRANDYGYGRLHVFNTTHVHWEFVDDASASVVNDLWLIKSSHGPFPVGLDADESEAKTALRDAARRILAAFADFNAAAPGSVPVAAVDAVVEDALARVGGRATEAGRALSDLAKQLRANVHGEGAAKTLRGGSKIAKRGEKVTGAEVDKATVRSLAEAVRNV